MRIHTIGYNDMFSTKIGGLENLTVIEAKRKTLAIEAPFHITKSLPYPHNFKYIGSPDKIMKVDALIVTHIDADHVSGFDYLLWDKVFVEKTKLILITHKAVAKDIWQRIKRSFGTSRIDMVTKMKLEDYVDLITLEFGKKTPIPALGIEIETFHRSTKHAPFVSIAFKIWKNKKSVLAYSGDTSFDPELIEFLAQGGNHPIIHEIGAYAPGSLAHTHIDELLTLETDIQERLFVNHVPLILEDMIKKIIKTANSPIRIAYELNEPEE
jgi:ribonuclease BN (tRNA processing enzyme)